MADDEDIPENDPEQLRSFSMLTMQLLMDWVEEANREVAYKTGWKGKDDYPAMAVARMQVIAHGQEYPELMKEFWNSEKILDQKYGTPVQRIYRMTNAEAGKRVDGINFLWRGIGPGKIDTRYEYFRTDIPDSIDFRGWFDD